MAGGFRLVVADGVEVVGAVEKAFDGHYNDKAMRSGLSGWQRSYAFVLAHGVDVVNSDMQNFAHFKENLAAVQRSAELFVNA